MANKCPKTRCLEAANAYRFRKSNVSASRRQWIAKGQYPKSLDVSVERAGGRPQAARSPAPINVPRGMVGNSVPTRKSPVSTIKNFERRKKTVRFCYLRLWRASGFSLAKLLRKTGFTTTFYNLGSFKGLDRERSIRPERRQRPEAVCCATEDTAADAASGGCH